VHRSVEARLRGADHRDPPFRYLVCGSAIPGIFNLGGDLGLFRSLIAAGDAEALRRYGHAAVEVAHGTHTGLNLPLITIALVQGDALGGGFECALAHHVIIAERSAKFGLPEIMFNLFPGMGAYNFIARRTNAATAERMIMSGRIYTGAELYDMGIVDVLAEDGRGEEALNDYVRKNARRHAAQRAIYQARQRVNPITLQDLNGITDLWVDTAMTLSPIDLKMMERLVAAQGRRRARAEAGMEDLAMTGCGD
jgi:DSF synthase